MRKSFFTTLLVIIIIFSAGCGRKRPKEHTGNPIEGLTNSPDSLTIIIDEHVNGEEIRKPLNDKWTQFIDTIGRLFILQFEYPEKYVAEQIQNTISVGIPIKEPSYDMTNTMEWFIAIEDGELYSVNYIIEQEKSFIAGGKILIQDTITLYGHDAVRLTIHENGISRKVIAQEKYPVTIVIIDQGRNEGFEQFFESIRFIRFLTE